MSKVSSDKDGESVRVPESEEFLGVVVLIGDTSEKCDDSSGKNRVQ